MIWVLGWIIIGMLFAAIGYKEIEEFTKKKAKEEGQEEYINLLVLLSLLFITILNILFWPLFLFILILKPFRRRTH